MKLTKLSFVSSSIAVGLLVSACSSDSESGGNGGGGTGTGAKPGTGGTSSGGTSSGGGGSGGTTAPCTPGTKQCAGVTPQSCDDAGVWKSDAPCPYACVAGACTGSCVPDSTQCVGLTPQKCDTSGNWVAGSPCPFACSNGACSGVCSTGEKKCKLNIPLTCATDGTWQTGAPCPNGCENGACKDVCKAGEFNCDGNEVQQCDVGPPPKWVSKSPQVICSASAGQACDKKTGTCITLQPLGTTTPTGTYYQYATFNSSAGIFKGGYDVDSFEDYIYVNRSSTNLDVYKVTLLDSDGDGKLEPDQHPNNPLAPGPIEQRTLTFVKTFTKTGDGAPLGPASTSELYALSDRIFSLGPSHNGSITEYLFNTKTTKQVAAPTTTLGMSHLGFGDLDGLWYAGNESNRRVYSWHPKSQSWVAEFAYPNLAGSHMDGMEVIVAPDTGEQYVYVSDMTSDFIGQYRRDPNGWVQVNLFKYADATGTSVEGMGFGALNHFWATGGSTLYEIGGGDLSKYLE